MSAILGSRAARGKPRPVIQATCHLNGRFRVGFGLGGDGNLLANLVGSGDPEAGVDVGKDAVAKFDLGEAGVLLRGDGAGGIEGLVDGLDLVEPVSYTHL